MHRLLTLFFVSTSCACPSYSTTDNQSIPLGCVSGICESSPWEPTEINTRFIVHDQSHLENPVRVYLWNASFDPNESVFDSESRLQFIIHGFTASSQEPWVQKLMKAFVQRDPQIKVILVDWSEGAFKNRPTNGTGPRIQAANNVLMVGRVTACFAQRIMSSYDIPETAIHIFGHSMGAQVMGRAAAWLSENFDIRIGTGTASDASSRPFGKVGIHPEKKDVHFMLAMHTTVPASSAEENHDGALGLYEAFAHVDLYPNRGTLIQPGCEERSPSCSHGRAHLYLTEMIANCSELCDFQGIVCRNEQDAVSGTCMNGTVDVCSFISSFDSRIAVSDGESTVLTFDTDMDRLDIKCSPMDNETCTVPT